jgi:hypothetical protein
MRICVALPVAVAVASMSCGGGTHTDLPAVKSPVQVASQREREFEEASRRRGADARVKAAAVPTGWTIIPPEEARTFVSRLSVALPFRDGIDATWAPSDDVAAAADAALVTALRDALLRAQPDANLPLSQYFRRYAGLVVARRRVVYVHGFHRRRFEADAELQGELPDWRRLELKVSDPWISEFAALYDPSRRKIIRIVFGGLA